jgi:hypothetical protein
MGRFAERLFVRIGDYLHKPAPTDPRLMRIGGSIWKILADQAKKQANKKREG